MLVAAVLSIRRVRPFSSFLRWAASAAPRLSRRARPPNTGATQNDCIIGRTRHMARHSAGRRPARHDRTLTDIALLGNQVGSDPSINAGMPRQEGKSARPGLADLFPRVERSGDGSIERRSRPGVLPGACARMIRGRGERIHSHVRPIEERPFNKPTADTSRPGDFMRRSSTH